MTEALERQLAIMSESMTVLGKATELVTKAVADLTTKVSGLERANIRPARSAVSFEDTGKGGEGEGGGGASARCGDDM
jgi:hypothetical protein